MIKKFNDYLSSNDNIISVNEDLLIFSDKISIFSVDRNNTNFDKDDSKTITHVRITVWHNKFKQREAIKKDISKELMPSAWHPTTRWDCCMPED